MRPQLQIHTHTHTLFIAPKKESEKTELQTEDKQLSHGYDPERGSISKSFIHSRNSIYLESN